MGYSSRRTTIVSWQPDGVRITPPGGAVFSGRLIELGYRNALGFLAKPRYSIGLNLPIGCQNSAAIQGWSILVGELPHRIRLPNGIQILLVG